MPAAEPVINPVIVPECGTLSKGGVPGVWVHLTCVPFLAIMAEDLRV
jgi:hypothetical protein